MRTPVAHVSRLLKAMAARRDNAPELVAERGRMVGMWQSGMSVRRIAEETGVSVKTVRRWLRRWEEEGHLRSRPRRGRPRATTQEQDNEIVEAVVEHALITSVSIVQHLQLPCNARTVQRRLHEQQFHCYVPAKKERLTQAQRDARLGFALQYLGSDEEFWKSVIFTDETCFCSTQVGKRHCWRLKNTRYNPENIQEIARSGRVSVSFWGWMWAYGPGELVKIDGRLTGIDYIQILEEVLLPSVRVMAFPHPQTIKLVQDNSPIHTSRVVQEWFAQHQEIELIKWPPKGCDLNPIENLWGIMSKDWDVGEERNMHTIERKALEVWESIRRRPNICRRLVESMPERISEVVNVMGGWSHY